MDLDSETHKRVVKTVISIVKGKPTENPMDSATLRAYFHRMSIQLEMNDYQTNHQHQRKVPSINDLRNTITCELQQGFNAESSDIEAIITELQQEGLTFHIDPPDVDAMHRCFHCFSTSRPTDDMLCEHCGGWFLSEMRRLPGDNGGWEDIFRPPEDMWRWTYRLMGPDGWYPPASQDSVEALSLAPFTSEDMCPICFHNFELGMLGLKMPCGHIFHQDQDCLLKWLKKGYTCPSCRFELPTADELFEIRRLSEDIIHRRVLAGLPASPFD